MNNMPAHIVARQVAIARERRALADERRRLLTTALHREPLPITDQLAKLREQADACRTQAILLNAKLGMIEHERDDLRALREKLAATSARLDSAVDDIVGHRRR